MVGGLVGGAVGGLVGGGVGVLVHSPHVFVSDNAKSPPDAFVTPFSVTT